MTGFLKRNKIQNSRLKGIDYLLCSEISGLNSNMLVKLTLK